MLMFVLTVTGAFSILLMVRSVFTAETNLLEAIALGIFGFTSFVITAILTNVVSP